MATLTASGVTTSNGQLDGFYTGTTANVSTLPIGVYICMVQGNVTVNQGATPYSPGNSAAYQYWSSAGQATGSVAMAGTWRSRGRSGGGGCAEWFMVQRVA